MSLIASELIVYGAANIAEADGATHGGAIDAEVRYVFDDSTLVRELNDTVDVVSDNAGDTTQTVTVTGRTSTGVITSEPFSLSGTSEQTGNTTFERILKVVVSAAHDGTINVHDHTGSTTIVDIESSVLSVRRPFYNVSADADGGSSRDFYEKVFVKNTNAVNALLGASVSEYSDPSGLVTFTLEDAVDDNESIASRLNTAPTGISEAFSDSAKDVPGTDLAPGSAIGTWLRLQLPAGTVAAQDVYTISSSGSTT